ncbi:hypothetical protein NDI85_21140 [Halomicroarcula sp. S1AR25-4]|uniref:hypothetical protein n=1 Tax=Haloarcula sp. S1AR25-4 TaxID=2950538 RepID=UPI0028744BFC|nr:hypothetical protein [Halomicroarcula sp. S1AR25-4]MDS0280293.1 hypothetical protein [Halomicroarcula sp. S1AR25-4]
MEFFGSTDTVDQKARAVLDDLSEDPSPFEILQTADQQAGDDVDPDTVVTTMRDLDEEVDAKLGAVEGSDVDQKAMRDAASAVADRTPLQESDALDLLSAAADSAEQEDASTFLEAFSDVAGVDQNALTDNLSTDMTDPTNPDSTDPDATPDDDGGVDQKQDGDGDSMDPIDLVEEIGGSDAADTVKNYAESVGKDVQEAAAEWVSENVPGVTVEGHGDSGGSPDAGSPTPDQPDMNGDGHDRDPEPDQMLDDVNINERVADAVTSDEVLDEMAGAVAQKLATDDDLADELVGTVEQKGDFATTDQTVATAPENNSQTVGDASPVTGGDDE